MGNERSRCESPPDLEFAGGFENCSSVLKDIETVHPDVILMDIEMPAVDGIEGVKLVKQKYPGIKIIMQTVFDDDDKVFASLQAGAEGYILKSATVTQIVQSIDEVIKGGAAMTPSIALKVIKHFSNQPIRNEYQLSPKERE